METVPLKSAPKVRCIVRAAFPAYRKHNAFVFTFPESGVAINTRWDSGSRYSYMLVNLATLGSDFAHKFVYGTGKLSTLPQGHALVQGGIFNGRGATAHVYLNPADAFTAFPE